MLTVTAIAVTVMAGCSTKGEQAAVKEEAAQIEAAHLEGREAARPFINRHFKDSMELQLELVKAGATRAKYDSMPRCRAAYDSAFISTVRTVNPGVAKELSRYRGR